MSSFSKMLIRVKRAIGDYDMIANEDRIAVGLSGGKDSLTTLFSLLHLRRSLPVEYTLHAITVDLGWPGVDWTPLTTFCGEHGIAHHIVPTQIGEIVFNYRQESNPCSLCSKMRNGALNDKAAELGCNVVALGHNRDDAIETLFLNLMYAGRIGCFDPVTSLDRIGLKTIRPLIYVGEATIQKLVKRYPLPVVASLCPANRNTKREHVKKMIEDQTQRDHEIPVRLLAALKSIWNNKS